MPRVVTADDFLELSSQRSSTDPIPYCRFACECDDQGYHGLYKRMFVLDPHTTTVQYGNHKGTDIEATIDTRWSFKKGIVLGVYNHWAIQRFIPSYPNLYTAFLTPRALHAITTLVRPNPDDLTILKTVTGYIDRLGSDLKLQSIPQFRTFSDGELIAFDWSTVLTITGGCEDTDGANVCTKFTREDDDNNKWVEATKVRNFYLLLFSLHDIPVDIIEQLIPSGMLDGTQRTYFSLSNIITINWDILPDWETIQRVVLPRSSPPSVE